MAGHNRPGGGFSAGLVAGAGLALVFAAGGATRVRATFPVSPWTLVSVWLLLASVTCLVPLFGGGTFLESGSVSLDLPIVGTLRVYSVLTFDVGVLLVVMGAELAVLETLGAREDESVPGEDAGPGIPGEPGETGR
jgi:multicomponent Na+:H+ antiporter subunit A